MTYLLPSVQLRQAAECLDCATGTGVTLTADDVVRLKDCFTSITTAVERLEVAVGEMVRDILDEALMPFVRPPEGVPAEHQGVPAAEHQGVPAA